MSSLQAKKKASGPHSSQVYASKTQHSRGVSKKKVIQKRLKVSGPNGYDRELHEPKRPAMCEYWQCKAGLSTPIGPRINNNNPNGGGAPSSSSLSSHHHPIRQNQLSHHHPSHHAHSAMGYGHRLVVHTPVVQQQPSRVHFHHHHHQHHQARAPPSHHTSAVTTTGTATAVGGFPIQLPKVVDPRSSFGVGVGTVFRQVHPTGRVTYHPGISMRHHPLIPHPTHHHHNHHHHYHGRASFTQTMGIIPRGINLMNQLPSHLTTCELPKMSMSPVSGFRNNTNAMRSKNPSSIQSNGSSMARSSVMTRRSHANNHHDSGLSANRGRVVTQTVKSTPTKDTLSATSDIMTATSLSDDQRRALITQECQMDHCQKNKNDSGLKNIIVNDDDHQKRRTLSAKGTIIENNRTSEINAETPIIKANQKADVMDEKDNDVLGNMNDQRIEEEEKAIKDDDSKMMMVVPRKRKISEQVTSDAKELITSAEGTTSSSNITATMKIVKDCSEIGCDDTNKPKNVSLLIRPSKEIITAGLPPATKRVCLDMNHHHHHHHHSDIATSLNLPRLSDVLISDDRMDLTGMKKKDDSSNMMIDMEPSSSAPARQISAPISLSTTGLSDNLMGSVNLSEGSNDTVVSRTVSPAHTAGPPIPPPPLPSNLTSSATAHDSSLNENDDDDEQQDIHPGMKKNHHQRLLLESASHQTNVFCAQVSFSLAKTHHDSDGLKNEDDNEQIIKPILKKKKKNTTYVMMKDSEKETEMKTQLTRVMSTKIQSTLVNAHSDNPPATVVDIHQQNHSHNHVSESQIKSSRPSEESMMIRSSEKTKTTKRGPGRPPGSKSKSANMSAGVSNHHHRCSTHMMNRSSNTTSSNSTISSSNNNRNNNSNLKSRTSLCLTCKSERAIFDKARRDLECDRCELKKLKIGSRFLWCPDCDNLFCVKCVKKFGQSLPSPSKKKTKKKSSMHADHRHTTAMLL